MAATYYPDDRALVERPGCADKLVDGLVIPTGKCTALSTVIGGFAFYWISGEVNWRVALNVGVQAGLISEMVTLALAYGGIPLIDHLHQLFDREPRVVPDGPRGKLLPDPVVRRRGEPRPQPNDGRRRLREATQRILAKAPRKRAQTYQQSVPMARVVMRRDPRMAPWKEVVDFYDVTVTMYDKSLARSSFQQTFEGGTPLYYKYVGDKDAPPGAPNLGLWERWGIIDKDGRGAAHFVYPLERILRMQHQVAAYAEKVESLPHYHAGGVQKR